MVAQHVGLADGLASERHYTVRTLPAGVARGLGDMVRHAGPLGTARAAAIVVGLATTTAGFVVSQIGDAWINDFQTERREENFRGTGRRTAPPVSGSRRAMVRPSR